MTAKKPRQTQVPTKDLAAMGQRFAKVWNQAAMHAPPHPGIKLRDDVLPELGLSVTQAATQLVVPRARLSRVLNGRAAVSVDMALRIEAWLGIGRGGDARLWLAEQCAYDLWQARQHLEATPLHVRPLPMQTNAPTSRAQDAKLAIAVAQDRAGRAKPRKLLAA
jgi:antitoxin HigA-1